MLRGCNVTLLNPPCRVYVSVTSANLGGMSEINLGGEDLDLERDADLDGDDDIFVVRYLKYLETMTKFRRVLASSGDKLVIPDSP